MESWWDEKLKEEEKRRKEFAKYSPDEDDDKKITIGATIQERLHEAAIRAVSYYEPQPHWLGYKPPVSMSCPYFVQPLENKNRANTKILGLLNWTKVKLNRIPAIKEIKVFPKKKKYAPSYLPIIFHWTEMEVSQGYGQSRIEKKHKCGYYRG